jgi:hypothetical protein
LANGAAQTPGSGAQSNGQAAGRVLKMNKSGATTAR